MFKQMKNIDTAFKQVKRFTIIVIITCIGFCGYVLYNSFGLIAHMQSRIYVLSNAKVLEAFASEKKDNIPVEARDHIRMFHHDFFTLDPDDKVIQANISKALYLADASAKDFYENLKENGYYANIISGNISQQISIDSIQLDINQYPFYFRCFATQKIIRTTSIVTRSLITEGFLRNVSRSDNNPHGFLIERWKILDNKDINIADK